jgi:hypothetical protein
MFDEKLTHAAWKSKPSWHVISLNDRTLSPAMEEDAAKRSGGVAVKLPTCHVAMLQEPEKVADVITEAAKEALAKTKTSASSGSSKNAKDSSATSQVAAVAP